MPPEKTKERIIRALQDHVHHELYWRMNYGYFYVLQDENSNASNIIRRGREQRVVTTMKKEEGRGSYPSVE